MVSKEKALVTFGPCCKQRVLEGTTLQDVCGGRGQTNDVGKKES